MPAVVAVCAPLTLQKNLNDVAVLHLEVLGCLVVDDALAVEEETVVARSVTCVSERFPRRWHGVCGVGSGAIAGRVAPVPMFRFHIPNRRGVLADTAGVRVLCKRQ